MPNKDGTGPNGQGALTGRRRGNCGNSKTEKNTSDSNNSKVGLGRGGRPRGGGQGKGFGGGRNINNSTENK